MKYTFKTILAVAALGAASVANAALIPDSGEVTITDTIWDGSPSINGGELDADFANGHQAYTFCVERGVPLAGYSKTYKYNLIDGITKGTAYLVKKFALGQLYVQDFGPEGGAHDVNAGALQAAIWYFEGQGGALNSFAQMAIDALAGATEWDAYTDGEVKVVELFAFLNDNKEWVYDDFQDQVVYIPDSGATLALLGLALGGLAIARRRR